jgi:TonB family protein
MILKNIKLANVLLVLTSVSVCAQQANQSPNQIPSAAAYSRTVIVGGVPERIYDLRDEITPPRPIPPAELLSDEARKNPRTGTVVLAIVITSKGDTALIRVMKSFRSGLDEKAIEAVRYWKFLPATKDGKPVSVEVVWRGLQFLADD